MIPEEEEVLTPERKREVRNAERRALAECRRWRKIVSDKLDSMTQAERIRYLNENTYKYAAEHGIEVVVSPDGPPERS